MSQRQVAEFAIGIALILGTATCGSPSTSNEPTQVPSATPVTTPPAREIAPSMAPSALQQSLAALKPVPAMAPGGVHKRIDKAVDAYLQRITTNRMYLALDKPIYQPGETIWFRTWELGTPDLMPATRSGLGMTFHLVSPKGAVVIQKRVAIAGGVARNDFVLPPDVPGGEYIIRALSDTGARVERNVVVSSYQPPRIKKKLEFMRKAYGPGDTVSAALSLHRATGEALATRSVTAIVGVDDREVARLPIATNAKGNASIKFTLPASIARGDGLLTVLVDDGGVVESIQKRIPITLETIKFSLFPEGGDLVAGLPARVYFSAATMIDKPADVQGRIIADTGAVIAEFASFHNGMGRFEMTPERGRSYRAEITRPVGIKQKFPLPATRPDGCSLQSLDDFDTRRDDLRVAVWCSQARAVIVTATQRERQLATQTVAVTANAPSVVSLPSARWQQGAVRVTLFSEPGAPLAERLLYRGHGSDLNIAIKADRDSYSPRDRVALFVETSDLRGQPVAADLAMAVVDDTVLSFADDKTAHLLAKMYLEHEMPGQEIEEPNFYFSDDPKAGPALDLVLGTLGWRRFSWQLILSPAHGADPTGPRWDQNKGFQAALDGPTLERHSRTPNLRTRQRHLRVLQRRNPKNPAPGNATAGANLLAQPATTGILQGTVTDQNGKPLPGVSVYAQSVATGRSLGASTDGSGRYTIAGLPPGMYSVTFSYQGVSQLRQVSIRLGRTTQLSGRIDTNKIVEEEPEFEDMMVPEAAMPAAAEPMPAPVRRAPPPKVAPPPPPPAVPVAQPMADAEAPALLPRRARERGEKQRMKLDQDKDWKLDDKRGGQMAWAPVREFPEPRYQTDYDGPRTDFRETIHWAPLVRTGSDGKATVEFYLSDAVTSFRATVEGVSSAGMPGRQELLVQSKLPVSLAAKLPLEVSAGDRVELPVTLANETARPLTAQLTTEFGRAFKLRKGAPARVTLPAGARKSFFYQLDVVGDGRTATDGRIKLSATAASLKDEVEQVIKVVPLGFPQQISLAGTVEKSARHQVHLVSAMPGTIDASLIMYPSPLATMTKGTEAIIREPHGCFEQASSANYPNVMVLAYLENHDAADPELVTRTHGLLERGYRKLTGYESPKKGYEWFGGDPGHEALTAYGLMEFADMAQVYPDTDMTMVARTASWLTSRRDGKGGYQRNDRALDSFGRASPEVTNGYITWAVSEARAAGIEVDSKPGTKIDLSTELAYQQRVARETKDPYLMALAAGVLVNLDKDGQSTRSALKKLAGMRAEDGSYPGADHSITRSGGQALTIETTSLAVLALLDSGPDHLNHVRRSIQWLDSQRSGFGAYGSTQSTILALKAMTRYAEASRVTRAGGVASLVINGKTAARVSFEAGRKDALDFGDVRRHLRAGKNDIEIRLDSEAPLPYSMAISYRSKLPRTSPDSKVALHTRLAAAEVPWGESVKMQVEVRNLSETGLPMTLARVGLPGGLTFQKWQLDELKDKQLIDFYETRAREVILYFRSLAPGVRKELSLELLATTPGQFVAPASSAYLYYTDEYKHWAEPVRAAVRRK